LNRFSYENDGAWHQPPLVSKMVGIRLKQGERVRLETPGGGGYGPAVGRDPAAVARDVRLGYLTAESADAAYGTGWRGAAQ
jgi:N-methylhydantoinase B